jgi:UDP-2,3-diacylglucosamine hydrolase
MSLYIVSDLHISGPEDPIYYSLLSLLKLQVVPGDTVVLAGDIFDLFIGNKKIYRNRYQAFLECVDRAVRRGIVIHYIEGNHDFLMERVFSKIQGMRTHSAQVSLEIEGKRFFVAHGDQVDSSDYGYRVLRALLRTPLMRVLLWMIPGVWLDRLGQWSSQNSRRRHLTVTSQSTIEKREFLRKAYRSYAAERLAQGYDFVVMGHCHDLDEMFFQIDGRPGQYVNVGFPRVHGSLLAWVVGEDKIHRQKLPESEGMTALS